MQMAFRVECPHCKWGYSYRNSHINQGILRAYCDHCREWFFFGIQVNSVEVEIFKEEPQDRPIKTA